jgi:hypothetical protein
MQQKESKLAFGRSEDFEYDFGPSTFTGEIADKEMDAVLDAIFDEALSEERPEKWQ